MVITDDCACLVEGAQVNVYPKKVVVGGGGFVPHGTFGNVWETLDSLLELPELCRTTAPPTPAQSWCLTGRSWAGATDASELPGTIRTTPFPHPAALHICSAEIESMI